MNEKPGWNDVMRKSWKTIVYIILTLVLIISIAWLLNDKSYEPLIGLLSAILALGGLLVENDFKDLNLAKSKIAQFLGLPWTKQTKRAVIIFSASALFFGILIGISMLNMFAYQNAMKPVVTTQPSPTPQILVGEWETIWESQLVIVNIPETPTLGKISGTIGYLFDNKEFHCGFDLWYGGNTELGHKYVPYNTSDYALILGNYLSPCSTFDIAPFEYYLITTENGNFQLAQVTGNLSSILTLQKIRPTPTATPTSPTVTPTYTRTPSILSTPTLSTTP